MLVGYARVSTRDQDLQAQCEALTSAGCEIIHREKESGARRDRPALATAIATLKAGDVLMVTRIDRLARSTLDLLNLVNGLVERGIGFRSLDDTWLDTTSPQARFLLVVFAGLAEWERDLIRIRTTEGRARAMASGKRFGRRPKMTGFQRDEAIRRLTSGETVREIAKSYDVDPVTIRRLGRALAS
jgi:DNA invertase Pin-like site-specific DNA recombinase